MAPEEQQEESLLSDPHRQMLEQGSAITVEVILARGYRTVTAEEARQYGFTGRQARAGLLLPVHTTDGQPGPFVLRPDNPRVVIDKRTRRDLETGDHPQKVIKYEWPRGREPRVDCPPPCQPQLKDSAIPLWITEGQKKGDALASWDLCTIDLPNGVWGWKSKQQGILADLDYIVWAERLVYVVFDSDVITKPPVAQALARLTKILSRRGARVVPVPLPQQDDDKLGVDDFKAGGGTLETLKSFAALGGVLPLKTDGRPTNEAPSAEYMKALTDLGYHFRMRAIDDTIEVNDAPLTDPLRSEIRTRMRDLGFKSVGAIEDAYTAFAYQNQYHPIKDYLNSLRWDGGDHIEILTGYFEDAHGGDFAEVFPDDEHADCGVFHLWLRRWLIGAVAKVLDTRQNMMLVIDGPQGCGKSFFVRWVGAVLPEYFIETSINTDDKDTWVRLMSRFVIEVGELGASLRRSDREALKSFISTTIVTLRKSYGKYDTMKPAMASLIGTINNEAGFLTDPTGNRRFMVCRITKVDWAYVEQVDPHQLWAQAVALYREQEVWLPTPEETVLQNLINQRYYMLDSPLEMMLLQYYEINPKVEIWSPAMEIITFLETMGLRGNQTAHLRELTTIMRKHGAEKGRPSIDGNRLISYRSVYRRK